MDFSKGYTASFYGVYIDPITRSERDRFEIISGSINRQEYDLRHSASLVLKDYAGLNDQWIRIYMVARQGSDSERVALFTGLASTPSISYQNGLVTTTVQCYSVLKSVADIILPIGWYAAAGANSGERLQYLLQNVPFPVYIDEDPPNLEYPLIAEYEETNLSMIDAIVDAMVTDNTAWRLQIEGDGSIYISKYTSNPVSVFSSNNPVIETNFTIDRDWFDCPNVFRAGYDTYTAIARDDDPESELSTVSRGREIWMAEESANVMDGESIGAYAERRLREEQSRSEKISYNRRFLPEVNQGDFVRLAYPEINGDYYVESQSINLGVNATVSEVIYKEVS